MSKSITLIGRDLGPLRTQLPVLLDGYQDGSVTVFTEEPFLVQIYSSRRCYVEVTDFSELELVAEDYRTNELLDEEVRAMSANADFLLVYFNDASYLSKVASHVASHADGLGQVFVDGDYGNVVPAQELFSCCTRE